MVERLNLNPSTTKKKKIYSDHVRWRPFFSSGWRLEGLLLVLLLILIFFVWFWDQIYSLSYARQAVCHWATSPALVEGIYIYLEFLSLFKVLQIRFKYFLKTGRNLWDSRYLLTAHTCSPQEAEIRIAVWNQPQAIGSWNPVLKIPNTEKGWQSG
jgi:hypothetical protein